MVESLSKNERQLFNHLVSAARIDCGTVSPSVFAAFRLTTSSNLVGCSTGKSAGFAPLRTYQPFRSRAGTEQAISVRSGLHTGEVELKRDNVTGIAVHVAARCRRSIGWKNFSLENRARSRGGQACAAKTAILMR